ncbi:hypothetical protein [Burkholderia ubonensis]|uniref:hypothetical protein n=1 Tax=Burkholderia ubonensis TaxID=101571 RepID=UPI0012FC17B2|nr:hypothetical protein [Burkholderia ubonensis]
MTRAQRVAAVRDAIDAVTGIDVIVVVSGEGAEDFVPQKKGAAEVAVEKLRLGCGFR